MNVFRRNLTARLIGLSILMTLLGVLAIAYISFYSAERIIIDRVAAQLESVTVLKEHQIGEWRGHLLSHFEWLSEEPRIEDAARVLSHTSPGDSGYAEAQEGLAAEFNRIIEQEDFSIMLLLDSTSGEITAASDEQWIGKLRAHREYFQQGKESAFISEIYHSAAREEPTMVVSAPVVNNGELVGVIAAHVNLDSLNEVMVESAGLGETGETYLVNRDHLLLNDTRLGPGRAFQQWIFTEGVNKALEGDPGTGTYPDYRGVPVIGYYHLADSMDVVLVAEVDQAEAFAPINYLRHTIAIAGVILLAVILGMVIMTSRQITMPIRKLAQYSRKVRQGEPAPKLKIEGEDEIASLAADMSLMVDQLTEREHKLRTLSHRLVEIQEEERRSIARELHDQTSQSLALIKIYLDRAATAHDSEIRSWLGEARETVSEVIDQVRTLSLDLRPAMLDDLGLLQALNWHFQRYTSRTNVRVDFSSSGVDSNVPPELRTAAFRIIQEALSNVARHARVDSVAVRVWVKNSVLKITVKDAGIGFDPMHVPSTSAGLSGMRERVDILNGSLNIESEPGGGTCLTVGLPMSDLHPELDGDRGYDDHRTG
ncbi:MAG: hypothetical protein IBX68_04110 [Dehalococcoidia bacterium]|nr:hypothetical protein [Dehalococcoidia bacterium]